jgi:hypothetical protein
VTSDYFAPGTVLDLVLDPIDETLCAGVKVGGVRFVGIDLHR